MNKGRKKVDRARSMAIKWVATKMGYTSEHIRGTVNGTYKGGTSEEIMAMFRRKYQELKEVLS